MVGVTDDALSALQAGLGLEDPTDTALDPARPTVSYAYLVQVSADGSRWSADWTEPSGGFERSSRPAARVARQVLRRRFLQLRADDATHWHNRWFRVDVWSLDAAASGRAGSSHRDAGVAVGAGIGGVQGDPAEIALSGRHLQSHGIAPDAVEVRTPGQVRDEVTG